MQASEQARDFVQRYYGARAGALSPLGGGAWSRAYALVLDGREAVIRFGAHRDDYAKDALMARWSGPDLPIPRVLEIGEAPGGYFAVSQRAAGVPLEELDGAGMRAVLPSLLRTLDAIAAVPVPPDGGYGAWGPGGRAAHALWGEALLSVAQPRGRLPGWRARLETRPEAAHTFDRALQRLAGLVPALPAPRRVIHQDLLAGNVLVQASRISAVLDWGNALHGDPLYDAAWLLYWWPWHPPWGACDIRGVLIDHWEGGGGQPALREERLHCYQLHIGLDALAYTAFMQRWDDVRRNCQQLSRLLAEG